MTSGGSCWAGRDCRGEMNEERRAIWCDVDEGRRQRYRWLLQCRGTTPLRMIRLFHVLFAAAWCLLSQGRLM